MSLDCHYFHMNVGIGARIYALIILYDNIAVGYFVPLLELAFSEGAEWLVLAESSIARQLCKAHSSDPTTSRSLLLVTFTDHFR